ncbi:hypothetical protein [Sneathiella chinensis]|uniref:Uncharacterized protein n=1 Tax=Sneathiella chinensis TaxID=349750 RepID=A0ABQ5U061_9PROT|nr:hypothetical protein [Sneathiella chinensis]GLQ05520.1 hypothetical protein GCM10007924_07410 [Sneathiella chinensis]
MKPFHSLLLALILSGIWGTTAMAGSSIYSTLAPYEPEDCKPVVEQNLKEQNADFNKIYRIEYLTRYLNMSEDAEEYNYEAWVSFGTCTGNYAIIMDKGCMIRRTFLTGQCQQAGIPTP